MASVHVLATAEHLNEHLEEHGYDCVDEDAISPSLLCPIDRYVRRHAQSFSDLSSSPFVDPIILRCSHMISLANAAALAERAAETEKTPRCPMCRAALRLDRATRAPAFVIESLDAIPVRCVASPACEWVGPRGNLKDHWTLHCQEAITQCSCGHYGRRGLAHPPYCPKIMVDCPGSCGVRVMRSRLARHVQECLKAAGVEARCASRLCAFIGTMAQVYDHGRHCGFLGKYPVPSPLHRPHASTAL